VSALDAYASASRNDPAGAPHNVALSTLPAADVLYIHPAKQEVTARYDRYIASPTYPLIPVGVVGLANSLLARGLTVRGLNLPLELLLDPVFDLRAWLARRGQPRLIMVDLHWYEHSFGALDVARACKAAYPQTPLVLGGLTATRYAGAILARFSEVDYVIRGDAEKSLELLTDFCRLVDTAPDTLASIPNLSYRVGGKVRETARTYVAEAADLDRLDFVDLGFLEHHESYSAIQYTGAGLVRPAEPRLKGHWLCLGRGCVYDCSYCGGARSAHQKLAGRDGVVLRSAERTIEDVVRLHERGIHQVSFTLDPCIMGPTYWEPLLGRLTERGVRTGLYNEFFQLPSEEFVSAFAGVADPEHTEVALSPLSGSERVRRLNGKQFGNAELLDALGWLSKHELPLYVYFSLNLPGETQATFRETLRLAEEICRRYPPHLLRMINKCHTIDPVSPMSVAPTRYGVRAEFSSFMDYYQYCERTAWQARYVTRGTLRGFSAPRRPAAQVEQMAREWDAFAQSQQARVFPVPRGW